MAEITYKPRVILVTDGDSLAHKAVEIASANVGARCISASSGNPTPLTGEEIIDLIMSTTGDPVVVMVDDRGKKGVGKGEKAMATIIKSDKVKVIGIVAVSSNGKDCRGIDVSFSINKDGEIIENAVDKNGNDIGSTNICGDTLSILKKYKSILKVGIGDLGRMDSNDSIFNDAPVTTKALKEIIARSGPV